MRARIRKHPQNGNRPSPALRAPSPGVPGEGEEATPPDSPTPGSLNSATSKRASKVDHGNRRLRVLMLRGFPLGTVIPTLSPRPRLPHPGPAIDLTIRAIGAIRGRDPRRAREGRTTDGTEVTDGRRVPYREGHWGLTDNRMFPGFLISPASLLRRY